MLRTIAEAFIMMFIGVAVALALMYFMSYYIAAPVGTILGFLAVKAIRLLYLKELIEEFNSLKTGKK